MGLNLIKSFSSLSKGIKNNNQKSIKNPFNLKNVDPDFLS
jgi:hypothetical protein